MGVSITLLVCLVTQILQHTGISVTAARRVRRQTAVRVRHPPRARLLVTLPVDGAAEFAPAPARVRPPRGIRVRRGGGRVAELAVKFR